TALARRHILVGMKTQHLNIAKTAEPFALILRADGLRAIFDHTQIMFLRQRIIGSRSQESPVKCTGISTRVRLVIAASKRDTSILSVWGSIPTSPGLPPASTMVFSVATNVSGVVITSSPSSRLSASNASCKPAVADDKQSARLPP